MNMEKVPFNDFLIAEISKTSAKATLLKFLRYKQELITEDEINIHWMIRFSEFLDERNLTPNSKKLYVSIMHSIMRKAKRREYAIPLNIEESVIETRVKKEASESIYLTADELKRIEDYEPVGTQAIFAWGMFLACAYTGCRISDGQILTMNNVHDGELNYTSIKTKITSRLPAHPKLEKWLSISGFHHYDEDSIRGIVGREMKIICENVGIVEMITIFRRGERVTEPKWKLVSSHTARKSFATNMLLDGYTIEQISKMMGHSSIEMTNRYICISHSDRMAGTFSYLAPEKKDELFVRLESILNLGLTIDIAEKSLIIAGVSKQEVERVKNKYNLSLQNNILQEVN